MSAVPMTSAGCWSNFVEFMEMAIVTLEVNFVYFVIICNHEEVSAGQ